MEKLSLYRYVRAEGGVTVSPVKPEVECTELFRLVADAGFVLTDGNITTSCTDTDTPDVWLEIADAEATSEDYEAALSEFGVKV